MAAGAGGQCGYPRVHAGRGLGEAGRAVGQGPVFSKDFPHHVAHMWTDERLDMFDHSFLIRDPAKTLASLFRYRPDFHFGEAGVVE